MQQVERILHREIAFKKEAPLEPDNQIFSAINTGLRWSH
jgi:hypothetical protein